MQNMQMHVLAMLLCAELTRVRRNRAAKTINSRLKESANFKVKVQSEIRRVDFDLSLAFGPAASLSSHQQLHRREAVASTAASSETASSSIQAALILVASLVDSLIGSLASTST